MRFNTFISLLLIWFFSRSTYGQNITNIRFEQSGKNIVVTYDLSAKTSSPFTVVIYCSTDGGNSWDQPLKRVTGDIGDNVKPGTGKTIAWDVLAERDKLVGVVTFKLEARPKSLCYSFTITHTAGNVAPVTKTVTYNVVETNLTGSNKCWITQNLGADHPATSATDATEASAGWYWQFNRKQGYKHDDTQRTPNTTWITSISENSDWVPVNDPCTLLLGSGWRLPTGTEWEKADATGDWENYNETFATALKLHAAGCLTGSDGSLYYRGSYGNDWSSSQYDSDYGRSLYFLSGISRMYYYVKAYGFSARCLRD